ncbi:GntR family transcriptional regulator [Pseudoclavibacter endophyticus]|uniref:GntR family transcriptional regulator n=1 Tax=Pseudoclavibacter endophyticus TaxID=1778590 RepID=A0A6H9WF78_9MICO|nr:GntR family transcriptional regulator [Pseudoclavibacter endophyticus]KAB1649562.1 GntR family transcriptional regulator [Pseudoclavibacter endophyticus]GGA61596.1 GntR family transcriptional regulator [Pseudoclavibacter endophyticus]
MHQVPPLGATHDDESSLLVRLRRLVLSGDYPPGTQLAEVALAQEFDVSRTPVREALKQLENEGLVEIRPKVGTFVRTPTQREIVELFELKEGLEGLAAGLLARRGTTPELDALERNLDSSDAAAETDDTEAYARLVHEFHWTIVLGADNTKLTEHYERLMNQLAYHRIVLRTVQHPGRIIASTGEHRAIVEAIRSKDALGAEFAMRDHVAMSSREALLPAGAGRNTVIRSEPAAGGTDDDHEHGRTRGHTHERTPA